MNYKGRVLHLFPYEKFTDDYVLKINKLFLKDDHIFMIFGHSTNKNIKSKFLSEENVILIDDFKFKNHREIFKAFKECYKIILHSLFIPKLLFVELSIKINKYKKKLFLNVWGGDLYDLYWSRDKNLKHKMYEIFRCRFFKHLKAVGYIKGDFEYLRSHYSTNPKFYLNSYNYSFNYIESTSHEKLNILIANSASETCQHIEAMHLIKSKKLDAIVWVILSYPQNDINYINSVIEIGKSLFGDNFRPITKFMQFEEYNKFLSNIDIAVFNNNRQQGLGNIASLLYLGKTIYINELNACYEYFRDIGCHLFPISYIGDYKLNEFERKDNLSRIEEFFSDEKFTERWKKIFEDDFVD